MRWLVVNSEYPPIGGGAANANFFLLKEWSKIVGLEIDQVTIGSQQTHIKKLNSQVTIHFLDIGKRKDFQHQKPMELLNFMGVAKRYCEGLIKEKSYDLAIGIMGVPNGYIVSQLGLPYMVLLRGSDVPFHNPKFKALDLFVLQHVSKKMWRNAAAISVLGKTPKSQVQALTPELEPVMIPNGIDPEGFQPGNKPNDGVIRILSVGRLAKVKGPQVLMKALRGLDPKGHEIEVNFVGDGPLREELENVAKFIDHVHINFTGQLGREDLIKMYQQSDIFVLSSIAESQGNVTLEAMACGLPMVVSETGASDVIEKNGVIVPCGDSGALAQALEDLIEKPSVREEFGKESVRLAANYRWDKTALAYYQLALEVLKA